MRYDEALEDADKAIGIDATFAKAFWRRGEALSALKRYPEALQVSCSVPCTTPCSPSTPVL